MSLANTLALNFIGDAPEFDKNEFRVTSAGAFNTFMRQNGSGWITDDLRQKVMASFGNTVQIPAIQYKDVTIRSTRPLVIPADENTSVLYTITYSTLAYGFKMYPMQHHNNMISYQQDWNKKFRAMIVKMMTTLEGLAVAKLDAEKTQVIGEVTGGHTFSGNVVSETGLSELAKSYILADLSPMMQSNDYYGLTFDVIGNQGYQSVLNRLAGFSDANYENRAIQFQNKMFHFSNEIANAVGKSATGFAVADGNLGIVTRVEPDSLYGTRLPNGHEWSTVEVPGIGLPFGSYYYTKEVDASGLHAGTSGLSRTTEEAFDWAIDIALLTPYNSDAATIPTPIIKFDLETA
jgi:hypothetical protein